MAGFADELRLDKFIIVHFKRWQVKSTLSLTALKVLHICISMLEGISNEDQIKSRVSILFLLHVPFFSTVHTSPARARPHVVVSALRDIRS